MSTKSRDGYDVRRITSDRRLVRHGDLLHIASAETVYIFHFPQHTHTAMASRVVTDLPIFGSFAIHFIFLHHVVLIRVLA